MELIGQRLKEARKKKGLSQEEVAERAGLSQASVSLIESGGRIAPRGRQAIADVVGVKLTGRELVSR